MNEAKLEEIFRLEKERWNKVEIDVIFSEEELIKFNEEKKDMIALHIERGNVE